MFAGCTKADSAKYIDVKTKFNTEVAPYVTTKSQTSSAQTGSAIIVQKNNCGYYFEFGPDNADLSAKVNTNEQDNQYYVLNNDGVYAKFLTYASSYFFDKLMNEDYMVAFDEYLENVPQKSWTALYNSTDDVINQIKEFGEKYRKLSSLYDPNNSDATNSTRALNNLVLQYKNLIGSVLKQNLDAQDVFDNYLFQSTEVSSSVPQAEINRLVDAYKLYFTEYLYQRYMVLGTGTLSDSKLLAKLDQIANATISEKDSTQVTAYNYLLLVEKTMQHKIEENRKYVEIIQNGISQKDYNSSFIYLDFTAYEQDLIDYADALLTLING